MSPARTRLALALALVAGAGAARAEDPARRIDLLRFDPTPGAGLVVHDAAPLGHLVLRASVWADIAGDPLIAGGSDRPTYTAVERLVTAHVTFALGLGDRLELGAELPVVVDAAGDAGVGARAALSGLALGDVRIVPKVRLVGGDAGLGLALVPAFTVPTGRDDRNAGEKGATFAPELVATWRFAPGTALGLSLGYRMRPALAFGRLLVDDEVLLAASASLRLVAGLGLTAEVVAALGVGDSDDDPEAAVDAAERPVEALGALTYTFDGGAFVVLGGGAGLTQGYGAPAYRAFLGVGAAFDTKPPPDGDGDGVMDGDDACGSEPEDRDGFEDGDGCPDADDDGDGVLDGDDRCLRAAEDRDGFEDGDGCPDADDDGDGVLDGADRCPREVEDHDGFADADGCADPDDDGDGVGDGDDRCPREPETKNGVDDGDGCPDTAEATLTDKGIELTDSVYFVFGQAGILAKSEPLIDKIARLLEANPQVTRIRIEGHTDNQGSAPVNLALSKLRAKAVLDALVARGVAPERLESEGYGATRLVCKVATQECHAKNRRTEFRLVTIHGRPVGDAPAP